MNDFAFSTASGVSETFVADGHRVALIAGGTELLNWMRLGIADPQKVVDISRLENMDAIWIQDGYLVIGSLATLNSIGENSLVVEHARTLAQACLSAASPQVRNRATLGGNVLQKTRCAYFRAEEPLPWACNKRHSETGCAARFGLNERHAIFGWTDVCVAVQPSDPAVALACLDAEAQVQGFAGCRTIAMSEFHFSQAEAVGVGGDPAKLENQLRPSELIVSYRIPVRPEMRSAYVKVRERASYEYALVSAAAAVIMDQDRISHARIALGSVAQKPWRLFAAEGMLEGKRLTVEDLAPTIDAALSDAKPLTRNAFKVPLARNAAIRAILLAGAKA